MAIGTDDLIEKWGSETEVTVATPGTISDGSFSNSGDVTEWTNSDDAPFADFLLIFQNDTTQGDG